MRKMLLLFVGVTVLCTQLFAQTRTITGTVKDASGKPIPNASVVIKGTSTGTTTNEIGNYLISLPDNAKTLVVSSVGFAPVEVNISGKSTLNVDLKTLDQALSEVVVIAYGTAKKESFTGSVNTLSSQYLKQRPFTNVTQALAGAAPGVSTNSGSGQPGSGLAVRIRGFGSVSASLDPLYVVDGIIYNSSIANLNINDIESITVLKDGPSSALYGSKAANGVIAITTKKGRRGQNQVSLNVSRGVITRAIPEYDRVNAFQYYPLMWEAARNSLAYSGTTPIATANSSATNGIKALLGYNPFNVPNNNIVGTDGTLNPSAQLIYGNDLDWFAPIARNGSRGEYGVSFSGGADKSDYYVSLGYTNEKGFVTKSDYDRYTARLVLNTTPLKWFKTGLNLSGTMTKSNTASDGSSTGYVNPFFFSRNIGPIYPVYQHDTLTGSFTLDQNGQKIFDLSNTPGLPIRAPGGSPGRHIVAETLFNDNLFKRNVLGARTYAEITFLKELTFRVNVGVDITNQLNSRYENKIVGDGAPAGRSSRTNGITTTYTLNQLLTYNKSFGDHSIEALAGHENYDDKYEYLYGFRIGQVVDGNTELGNFTTTSDLDSRTDRQRTEGYFTRLNYGYNNKYFVTGSYRKDGSSRFSRDVRWGDFWSVGLGWRVDKEKFLTNVGWVDLLKLRTSYGEVGNDNVSLYAYQGLYSLGFNNNAEPGFVRSSLPNPQLTWETNKQLDGAVEFALFKNRVKGTVEYYRRKTDGLLFNVPLPLSSGVQTIDRNVGSMYNEGFEIQLGVDIVRTRDFTWSMDINASTIKNRITKLPEGQKEIISGTKKLMVGHSIYDFWLRDWYGVDPTDGSALYVMNIYNAANTRISKTGDSVTTNQNNAKFIYSGSAIPDVYGGLSNTFTYKNFDLTVQLTYQFGGQVYDATYAGLMHSGDYGSALHKDALNRWQKPGDITNVPRMDNAKLAAFGAQSDRWLTDATFINVRSLNVGYNLPKSYLDKIHLQTVRFYLSGENLFLSTKRLGMNVTQSFTGVTSNAYVPARIIAGGLNITL